MNTTITPAGAPPTTSAATTQSRTGIDRFLVAIIVGVGLLLIVAAVSLVLARMPAPQLPADSPAGTVQQFYLALQDKNYEKAYGFLSDRMLNKPTQADFVLHNMNQAGYYGETSSRITLNEENIYADYASVTVNITRFYGSSGPFGGSGDYTSVDSFTLVREDEAWRITELPWGYIPYR
jgi:hypothetical protein